MNAHLGRQIFGRATERARRLAALHVLLAQAKVGDDQVAFVVEQ